MHHRLGGPLPRQQTNAPQVHPRPIPERMFHRKKMPPSCTSGFVLRFQSVFPVRGQVPYVLLTRSPLETRRSLVRLACIRHAASVHPEPGSNSPFDLYSDALRLVFMIVFQVQRIDVVSSCIYFVFPVHDCFSGSKNRRCIVLYLLRFSCPVFKERQHPSQMLPSPAASYEVTSFSKILNERPGCQARLCPSALLYLNSSARVCQHII